MSDEVMAPLLRKWQREVRGVYLPSLVAGYEERRRTTWADAANTWRTQGTELGGPGPHGHPEFVPARVFGVNRKSFQWRSNFSDTLAHVGGRSLGAEAPMVFSGY